MTSIVGSWAFESLDWEGHLGPWSWKAGHVPFSLLGISQLRVLRISFCFWQTLNKSSLNKGGKKRKLWEGLTPFLPHLAVGRSAFPVPLLHCVWRVHSLPRGLGMAESLQSFGSQGTYVRTLVMVPGYEVPQRYIKIWLQNLVYPWTHLTNFPKIGIPYSSFRRKASNWIFHFVLFFFTMGFNLLIFAKPGVSKSKVIWVRRLQANCEDIEPLTSRET